jgi:hypothetical protein
MIEIVLVVGDVKIPLKSIGFDIPQTPTNSLLNTTVDYEGSFAVRTFTEMLWEVYQKSGSYEDMCRWLKHRAWERIDKTERQNGLI